MHHKMLLQRGGGAGARRARIKQEAGGGEGFGRGGGGGEKKRCVGWDFCLVEWSGSATNQSTNPPPQKK